MAIEKQIKQTMIFERSPDYKDTRGRKTSDSLGENGVFTGTIDEQWLRERGEDELVDLLVMISSEMRRRKKIPTEKIALELTPSAFRDFSDIPILDFKPLPEDGAISDENAWYIVLVSYDAANMSLPLKLTGDVIIGRAAEGIAPHLDLSDFDSEKHGVSREQAKLCVTRDQLILHDLGSTNGTFVMGERIALGNPAFLFDQSILSFGRLHFKLIIIRRPGEVD